MPNNDINIEIIPIYGPTGAVGNGIVGIEKTGTSANVDTYTITYTNGDTDEFTVTNAYEYEEGPGITISGATLSIDDEVVATKTFTDETYLPLTTNYGASISFYVNTSTYVMTAQLKDQNGNNLGAAQTVDLPLESVVVNGAYDDETQKIVLTLQNGSTIEFSVADLISGLQSEITSSNMLDADLVDDTTSTNKFVTASDITNWNGKQNANTAVTHTASTSVGSVTKGVYIGSDGEATEMSYSLAKDVPADAVFTDTTYTFSTGLTNANDTVEVTDYNKLVKNTALESTRSFAVGGASISTNSNYSVAIGYNAEVFGSWANSESIAIGHNARAGNFGAIQIGTGTNQVGNTLCVGFDSDANYMLLEGATGLIPDARLSSNIARTSDVPAAQVQSDWNQSDTSAVDYIKNKPTLSTVTLKDWSVS